MTIEDAIKELEAGLDDRWCPWSDKMKASIRLGIEALKCVQIARASHARLVDPPLIGETKEEG